MISLLEESVALNIDESVESILSSLKAFSLDQSSNFKDDITIIGVQNKKKLNQNMNLKQNNKILPSKSPVMGSLSQGKSK